MAMLKTFDLKGNKLSFADWISNLSPCETPFVSMIPKEKVDQTQYSWQTDRLAHPNSQGATVSGGGGGSDPSQEDVAFTATDFKEGEAFAAQRLHYTKVHTNFTQIFRKAVRVSDTTKKVSLYGRGSELGYQMEKAGMEIKRDLEHTILNSTQKGRLGTASAHGAFDGFQNLVAPVGGICRDTGAIVHKVVNYTWATATSVRTEWFTKAQVFDLTYNLYLAGARANKIMFHPMHMAQFSDWVSTTTPSAGTGAVVRPPHMHRMFDGLDTKYNAMVKKIRDPLGQEFTLIPNRHMPVDQLFFFNENDWSQMVLREPQKITLAKMGSSEKQMIEFEVGLRHRNPFASGILKFVETGKNSVDIQVITPQNAIADNTTDVTIRAVLTKDDGKPATASAMTVVGLDDQNAEVFKLTAKTPVAATATDENFVTGTMVLTDKVKIPLVHKGKRVRVSAKVDSNASHIGGEDFATLDTYETRDK